MTDDVITWVARRLDGQALAGEGCDEARGAGAGGLDDETGLLVLAALEGDDALDAYLSDGTAPPRPVPPPAAAEVPEPAGAFLRSVSVEGFRGIGPRVRLDLYPAPGLTIVSGRNGSGKSSLAEALECVLTGSTYRWQDKKSALWRDEWRNKHHPHPARVEVEVAEQGVGTTRLGLEWDDDEPAADRHRRWLQRPGAKRVEGLSALGWDEALVRHRPMLSYDELGGTLEDGPSQLYDAMSKALGVEQMAAAVARLAARATALKAPEKELTARRKQLQGEAAALPDERAAQAARLLRRTQPDVAALRDLAVGTGPVADAGPLGWLRQVDGVGVPDAGQVEAAAARLRDAVAGMVRAGEAELRREQSRLELRRQALRLHDDHGDMTCPVCSGRHLDAAWAEASRDLLRRHDAAFAGLRAAQQELDGARRQAAALVAQRPAALGPCPLPDLAVAVAAAREAWDAWAAVPSGDQPLADHLVATHAAVAAAVARLRTAAAAEAQRRHDAWTPYATRLGAYADDLAAWSARKPVTDRVTAALAWLRAADTDLRNELLVPITDQARHAWARLRQESDVDLGALTLTGTATRRRVVISATVGGQPAGALAVMSQGELHALALALFLPRATMPASPFRFVVLDDPVQAMDPAKVDGLVQLLAELAETRQVVVFSHDDRLPAAARRAAVPVRILEVTRGDRSRVGVAVATDPSARYLRDALALCRDASLPEATALRVLPGLVRLAVEAAARDTFWQRRVERGDALADIEAAWGSARLTSHKVSLAVFDEVRDLGSWIAVRGYRRRTFGVMGPAFHEGLRPGDSLARIVEEAKLLAVDVSQRTKQ